MADPEDDHEDSFRSSIRQEKLVNITGRHAEKSKIVEMNADNEGDVSDISEEDRNSSSIEHQKPRAKRKVKKKRRSKSLTSNDGDTTSSDEDVSAIVQSSKSKQEHVNLVSL